MITYKDYKTALDQRLWVKGNGIYRIALFKIIFIGKIDLIDMLTRSKIKMEESIRHTHNDAPYFNTDYQSNVALAYGQSRASNSPALLQIPVSEQARQQASSRNQILKELRQEYEILRNLPIDDGLNTYGKGYGQQHHRLSDSQVSSSVRSKRSNHLRESDARSPQVAPRELEAVHLEKKQLQIVIGNSMRKIEQLLNNEITLKKTIHELKSQAEGKGGLNQQHDRALKAMQKSQDELQEQLNSALLENEKQAQRAKDLAQKVRQLQGELAGKEREVRQAFEEQRRLHESIRTEKDKYLNLEIQCKGYKMEIDLLEKEKASEVNRLLRQFESKEGAGEKEMAYLIRKLEEEIKEKDKRCHELLVEREQLKHGREREQAEPVSRPDKNLLEEMMYKSREMTDTNNKALTDSMNLIFVKMAELEKKNDETLKREMQALIKKSEENKRTSTEAELIARVAELERNAEREAAEKNRLLQEVSHLRDQKYELEDKNKDLQKKWKASQEQEAQFKEQIEELSKLKSQLSITYTDHKTLQEEVGVYISNIKSLQAEIDYHRQYVANLNLAFKEKEKKCEDEVRVLKRKVDEAEFETEKARREAEFNQSLARADHEVEAKRIVDENIKLAQKIKEVQETAAASRSLTDSQLKQRESEIMILKDTIDALRAKGDKDLLVQKQFYDAKLVAGENRYNVELKAFNDKFLTVTAANEKLLAQTSILASKETELNELRRLLKQSTAMNTGISHLWEIKEVEYGNINQVLSTLRTV